MPDQSDWVRVDLTDDPDTTYEPRLKDFATYLTGKDLPPLDGECTDSKTWDPDNRDYNSGDISYERHQRCKANQIRRDTLNIINQLDFSPNLKKFISTPFPIGFWPPGQAMGKCDTKRIRKKSEVLASLPESQQPLWLQHRTDLPDDTLILEQLPGAAIYDMICINCHGPQYDSHGRQADTVALLSGGESRVANFRDGLFGPQGAPGTNEQAVFEAPANDLGISTHSLGARYMSWMALGGTTRTIPDAVLRLVSKTDVAGVPRRFPLIDQVSANMLQVAESACRQFASTLDRPANSSLLPYAQGITANSSVIFNPKWNPLIQSNGDAELWQALCTADNPPFVHEIYGDSDKGPLVQGLVFPGSVPTGTPLKDHRGQDQLGVQAGNLSPWCIGKDCSRATKQAGTLDMDHWARRGAVNAGFAVFYALHQITSGEYPAYPNHYGDCVPPPVPPVATSVCPTL